MSDSMREEFEAWAEVHHKEAGNWYERDGGMFERFADGSYQVRWLESDFISWQASRESMVIDLGAMTNNGYDGFYPANQVKRALRDSGVKTK